jgi:hypothetical protein
MYDRLKDFLSHCLNVLVMLILLLGCGAYVLIATVITSRVINDLRLDTYVAWDTGFGIVMLVFLLGWGPAWFLGRSARSSTRYVGRL